MITIAFEFFQTGRKTFYIIHFRHPIVEPAKLGRGIWSQPTRPWRYWKVLRLQPSNEMCCWDVWGSYSHLNFISNLYYIYILYVHLFSSIIIVSFFICSLQWFDSLSFGLSNKVTPSLTVRGGNTALDLGQEWLLFASFQSIQSPLLWNSSGTEVTCIAAPHPTKYIFKQFWVDQTTFAIFGCNISTNAACQFASSSVQCLCAGPEMFCHLRRTHCCNSVCVCEPSEKM